MVLQKKVCFMSVCHAPLDDRIYKKEALTLAKNGFDVYHICYGDENQDFVTNDNIRIIQLQKKRKGKSLKTVFAALKQTRLQDMFEVAKNLNADVYHLHDVELCSIAMQLKKLPHQPKVIYDAHEPYDVFFREFWYKRPFVRFLLSDLPAVRAEKRILSKVDYLIATETNVANRFRKQNPNTAVIYNYSYFNPKKSDLESHTKEFDVVYCGSISQDKGIFAMLDALIVAKKRGYELKMVLVGACNSPALLSKIEHIIQKENLKDNVVFTGEIPLEKVSEYYEKSKTAFCLFALNRTNATLLPIKLFEYAAFGLPIIGSDFGHIGKIIRDNDIGVCVHPHSVEEVATALIQLIKDDTYKQYISRCMHCVKTKYLWENQQDALLKIYRTLL